MVPPLGFKPQVSTSVCCGLARALRWARTWTPALGHGHRTLGLDQHTLGLGLVLWMDWCSWGTRALDSSAAFRSEPLGPRFFTSGLRLSLAPLVCTWISVLARLSCPRPRDPAAIISVAASVLSVFCVHGVHSITSTLFACNTRFLVPAQEIYMIYSSFHTCATALLLYAHSI